MSGDGLRALDDAWSRGEKLATCTCGLLSAGYRASWLVEHAEKCPVTLIYREIVRATAERVVALDSARLAAALVATFRDVAKEHWPWLRGDGWPAYSEHDAPDGEVTQVLLVNEIAERLAAEYEATRTAEDPQPPTPWNDGGRSL